MDDEEILYFYALFGTELKLFQENGKIPDEIFFNMISVQLSSRFYHSSKSHEEFKNFVTEFIIVCEMLWKDRQKEKSKNDKSFESFVDTSEGTQYFKNDKKEEKAPIHVYDTFVI